MKNAKESNTDTMTKRVLLLSAGYGDGHRQVASALQDAFVRRGAAVSVIDCFQETNRFMTYTGEKIYELSTRYAPSIYGLTYTATRSLKSTHVLWKVSGILSKRGLHKHILEYQPHIVLQLFPDQGAASLPRMNGEPFVGVVLTDFSVHSRWFHQRVDTYFIPHQDLLPAVHQFSGTEADVISSGIPIRPSFKSILENAPQVPALQPYIVISTGGRGVFSQLGKVIQTISKSLPGHGIYVLCGRNSEMLHQVQEMSRRNPTIHGLPFVNNVAHWYGNADLAVVKAGGITVSECLACSCPMVFYKPQPGQEADNARFIESRGAGIVAEGLEALKNVLTDPVFPLKQASMKATATQMGAVTAADDIADYVLQRV